MRAKHILVPVLATALAAAGIIAVQAGTANADDDSSPLTVMTRNMDLGSDLGPVLMANTLPDFLSAVTGVYKEIADSNIPERADGIAAEIGQSMPMVVSLQELTLVQRYELTPTFGPGALIDQIDQLADLRAALARRGLNYTVAVDANEFDAGAPADAGYYVRLLDQNVILTRADLPAKQFSYTNAQSAHFADQLMLPLPGGPAVASVRGWASVDVTRHGSTVRVIDTHLEVPPAPDGATQAQELLAGPANTALPVVIAADINSGPGTGTDAFNLLAKAMTDTWAATKPNDPGLTWPLHGEDNGLPQQVSPNQRIDVIFSRGLRPVTDTLIGTGDLTASGLYPSDHAGVLARLAPAA
jgi:endonuclease/exonuclease/phosphatase family metal-dependent hydrolase